MKTMPSAGDMRIALENDIAEFEAELAKLPDLRRRLGIVPDCHREIEMEGPEEDNDDGG